MALRDKLEALRKRQSLGVLREELSKNEDARHQLKKLIDQSKIGEDAETVMALYSSSWYNVRVRDELEFVESRCNNLSDELHTVQTDMARAEQRRAKKQEYADNLQVIKESSSRCSG